MPELAEILRSQPRIGDATALLLALEALASIAIGHGDLASTALHTLSLELGEEARERVLSEARSVDEIVESLR